MSDAMLMLLQLEQAATPPSTARRVKAVSAESFALTTAIGIQIIYQLISPPALPCPAEANTALHSTEHKRRM